MKTRVDGYFYIPSLGPFLEGRTGPPRSLKVELLFDDPNLEGDQTGGTSPYPELDHWPDGNVDILDSSFVNGAYGSKEGDSNFDYMADINADKSVTILDVSIVSGNYGNSGTYITDLSGVIVEFDTGGSYQLSSEGFSPIPSGATYFYIKKDGNPIGALITFFKEPLYELTLNVDKEIGYVGDSFIFSGMLTENYIPVEGATVTLYKDSISTGLTDITSSDGKYSIEWIANEAGKFVFFTEAAW